MERFEERRSRAAFMLDEVEACSPIAMDTAVKAYATLNGPDTIERSLEVSGVITGNFTCRQLTNGLSLVHRNNSSDAPLLVADITPAIAVPIAGFERRQDGQCSYIQLGSEITDDNLITTQKDVSRLDQIEAIRNIITGTKTDRDTAILEPLITQEKQRAAQNIQLAQHELQQRELARFSKDLVDQSTDQATFSLLTPEGVICKTLRYASPNEWKIDTLSSDRNIHLIYAEEVSKRKLRHMFSKAKPADQLPPHVYAVTRGNVALPVPLPDTQALLTSLQESQQHTPLFDPLTARKTIHNAFNPNHMTASEKRAFKMWHRYYDPNDFETSPSALPLDLIKRQRQALIDYALIYYFEPDTAALCNTVFKFVSKADTIATGLIIGDLITALGEKEHTGSRFAVSERFSNSHSELVGSPLFKLGGTFETFHKNTMPSTEELKQHPYFQYFTRPELRYEPDPTPPSQLIDALRLQFDEYLGPVNPIAETTLQHLGQLASARSHSGIYPRFTTSTGKTTDLHIQAKVQPINEGYAVDIDFTANGSDHTLNLFKGEVYTTQPNTHIKADDLAEVSRFLGKLPLLDQGDR